VRENVATSAGGVPYRVPEVVLLFTAKAVRDKDIADLEVALPAMDAAQRTWLRAALAVAHPGHPWLERV
jgi:hypothetical protein